MSDRILADPEDRPAEPEPEAPVGSTPEPTEPTEPTEAEAEAEAPAPEDSAKKLREYQARIDALTREKWEARRDAEARAQRLAELERPQPQPGEQQDPVEVAKHQLRMEEGKRQFDAACNRVFAAGKEAYPDFEQAVSALSAVGAGQRFDFLAAVTQLPEGHKVYRQLASNLDEAARVLALPPMQMAVELARMEAKLAGNGSHEPAAPKSLAPPVSQAPAPIKPIGGASRAVLSAADPKVSMADFIRIRDKEESERRRL